MAFRVRIVKNSTKGGHRPISDYQADLEAALDEFAAENETSIDDNVRAILGARGFPPNTKKDRSYTHPIPFTITYTNYLFGCLSVPADLDDGRSDYSNFFFLASECSLVAIFNDPSWVYEPFFAGAVFTVLNRNEETDELSVGQVVVRIMGLSIAALDHSLEALENRYLKLAERVPSFASALRASRNDHEHHVQPIQDLAVEVNSLAMVVGRTALLLDAASRGNADGSEMHHGGALFSADDRKRIRGLEIKAAQLVAFQEHLAFEVSALLSRCDQLQEAALTVATHRVTVLGALILVPNLLFDYFGQAFDPLPDWVRRFGFLLTGGLTIIYWVGHYVWFRRRRYL